MKNFQPCLEALDGNHPGNYLQYQKYVVEHPLFLISQRCHELFFSGMFAWMIKRYPGFAEAFFGNTINWAKQKLVVTEEEDWRDITIKLEDELYVIENKFKCFCDVEQLCRYSDNLRNYSDDECSRNGRASRFKAGVVLGVSDEEPECLPPGWEYKSYVNILGGLCSVYNGIGNTCKLSCFEKSLIDEFLKFLDGVLSVLSPCKPLFDKGYWPIVSMDELRENGIVVLMERMHAMTLADYLNNCGRFSSEESVFSVRANGGSVIVESCELSGPQKETLSFAIVISKKLYVRKIIPRDACQWKEWPKRKNIRGGTKFERILKWINEDILVAENYIKLLSNSGWKIIPKIKVVWRK